MAVSWDTFVPADRDGPRLRAARVHGGHEVHGPGTKLPDLERPALPPSVDPGGHGGSHGHLMNEFVAAILQDRKPLVDIAAALNMTVPGIVAAPVGPEGRREPEGPAVRLIR